MKYCHKTRIVRIITLVVMLVIVMLLGLRTKSDAADIKAVRSPIHTQYIGQWVRLSNDQASPEIIITPTFDLSEEPQDDVTETDVGNIEADQIADVGKMVEPDPQEVEWLAIAIFREAGSDWISNETRYMVGDVILTHVIDDRFPNTLYDVLTEKGKYGRFYWDGITWPSTAFNAGNKHAAERAREIAYNLLTDAHHSELWGKGYIWQDDHVRGKDSVWSDGICFGR